MSGTQNRIFIIICIFVITVIMLFLFWLTLTQPHRYINSDLSSELLLSKILSQENAILTNQWYYSTELRVLNMQVISTLLFKFLDNWALIRAITNLVLYILLLASYIFMMKQVGVKLKWILFSSILLFLPTSYDMLITVQVGGFYIVHYCFLFIYTALFIKFIKSSRRLTKIVTFCILLVLSFISGLSGIRYLMILIAPLALAVMVCVFINLKKHASENSDRSLIKRLLQPEDFHPSLIFLLLAITLVGYWVNSHVLNNCYFFHSFNDTKMIDIYQTDFFAKLSNIIYSLMGAVGYQSNVEMVSCRGINNMLILVFLTVVVYILTSIRNNQENKYTLIKRFFFASVILHLVVFLFTTMLDSVESMRYLYPVMVLFIPIFCIYMDQGEMRFMRYLVAGLVFLTLLLSSSINIVNTFRYNGTAEKLPAVHFLTENGYDFGYATFWNANIVTELTEGQIEVGGLQDSDFSLPFLWLTPKKYYLEGYHTGKCFLLTTAKELEKAQNDGGTNLDIIRQGTEVYNDGSYIVYEYPNTDLFPKLSESG